ncbi:MAG TPA: TonB family protein [Acidobacteriaceae bacterium]|nr:TonB family protein [Acidobacteriaceae bacterium]
MEKRPLAHPDAYRFAPYVAELREFFTTSRLPFGAPEHLPTLLARLSEPGPLFEDLSSLTRSIVLRQGGAMPHADLAKILLAAGTGAELQEPSDPVQFAELLTLVGSVMRRPWNVPSVVSVPSTPGAAAPESAPESTAEATLEPAAAPAPAAGLTALEPAADPAFAEPHQPVLPPKTATVLTFPQESPSTPAAATPAPRSSAPSAIGTALAEERLRTLNAQPHPEPHLPDPFDDEALIPPAHPTQDAAPSRDRRTLVFTLSAAAAILLAAGGLWAYRSQDVYSVQPAATLSATSPQPKPSAAAPTARPRNISTNQNSYAAASAVQPIASAKAPHTRQPDDLIAPPTVLLAYQPPSTAQPQPTGTPIPAAHTPTSSPQLTEVRLPTTGHTLVRRDPDAHIVGDLPIRSAYPLESSARPRAGFKIASGIMAANLLSAPEPSYPTLARLTHTEGQVILQAVVARDGTVSATHVLSGHHLLRGAAQDAVRRWRFRPYSVDGHPVDAATIITVDFRNSD